MRVRAPARAPRVRFSRPGDSGALHNCVSALRARSRPERSRARRTRPHAVYVTRDHRARPLTPEETVRSVRVKCDRCAARTRSGGLAAGATAGVLVGPQCVAFVRARGGDGCGRVLNN